MIDPTALRTLCEQDVEFQEVWRSGEKRQLWVSDDTFDRILKVYRAVPALLDENAALRAERDEMDKQRRHWLRMHDSALDEAQALESRLAALKEAGEKVVEAHNEIEERDDPESCVCGDSAWDAFKAKLRSDP